MRNSRIRFHTKDEWLLIELYEFIHSLNVFYNRLYVFKFHFNKELSSFKYALDTSLYYVNNEDALFVNSLTIGSPGFFDFGGLGEILREIREFYKDFMYRNRQEEESGDIDLDRKRADLELQNSEVIRRKIRALEEAGFSKEEIKEIITKLITPAEKMINSVEKKDIHILEDFGDSDDDVSD